MTVVYEPRSFPIHDGSYPSMGEHEAADDATNRFSSPTDMEGLQRFSGSVAEDRAMLSDDVVPGADSTTLDLPSPAAMPSTMESLLPSVDETTLPKEASMASPPSSIRQKGVLKPERDVKKQSDGKFYCEFAGCTEEIKKFSRKCEWSKHMDKHERPYRCTAEGCEKLPGFTYSGGLLRHEREVHNKHGGPKKTLNCPYANCKRNSGKGFSRQENLNEHLRRVHTNDNTPVPKALSVDSAGSDGVPAETAAATAVAAAAAAAAVDDLPSTDNETDHGQKQHRRKRTRTTEDGDEDDGGGEPGNELAELRDVVKRVCRENEDLRQRLERQNEDHLAMVAQIAELQETLRMHSLVTEPGVVPAPTAPMM